MQPFQIHQQILCRSVTLVRGFCQHFLNYPVEFDRTVFDNCGNGGRFFFQNVDDRVIDGFARKRLSSRYQFIEHDSKTENIRSRVRPLPAGLFGRHIIGGSHHRTRIRLDMCLRFGFRIGFANARALFDEFCQTKIQNLNDAIAADHNVFRLDVAVNDPGHVC